MSDPANTPPDDGSRGMVSWETLQAAGQVIAAQTVTQLFNAVMENAPTAPMFECEADRQRVLSWLEQLHEEYWSRINLVFPDSPDTAEGLDADQP